MPEKYTRVKNRPHKLDKRGASSSRSGGRLLNLAVKAAALVAWVRPMFTLVRNSSLCERTWGKPECQHVSKARGLINFQLIIAVRKAQSGSFERKSFNYPDEELKLESSASSAFCLSCQLVLLSVCPVNQLCFLSVMSTTFPLSVVSTKSAFCLSCQPVLLSVCQ